MKYTYRQGYLDLFCGIYALVNATAIVADEFTWGNAQDVFIDASKLLNERGTLIHVMENCIGFNDAMAIFDTILAPRFGLVREQPFKHMRKVSVKKFCREVDRFLKADRNHSVVTIFQNRHWVHWTVITQVKPKTLVLSDSARRTFLHRNFLTTDRRGKGKSTRILAKPTLFVYRRKIDLA